MPLNHKLTQRLTGKVHIQDSCFNCAFKIPAHLEIIYFLEILNLCAIIFYIKKYTNLDNNRSYIDISGDFREALTRINIVPGESGAENKEITLKFDLLEVFADCIITYQ